MADRGEHIEQRFVVGGRVVRRRARHQRDAGSTRDRRAFRNQPAISRVEVIAHEHHGAVPETFTNQLRMTQRFSAITMHQRIHNSAA